MSGKPLAMEIRSGDLEDPEVVALLANHHATASAETAAGSAHALDVEGLRQADLDLWTAWDGVTLLGCGALKALSDTEGEVKAMHTTSNARRQGVGSGMLAHIIEVARRRGYRRLSLETGSWPYFESARQLYQRNGFELTGPFGSYRADPNSVFMALELSHD